LVFIQKEWEKIWFLNTIGDTIVGEIEYNVLTDKTNIVKSTDDFIDIYNHELNQLKTQLNEKTRIKTNY
jgi:flagellar capping protein FliD